MLQVAQIRFSAFVNAMLSIRFSLQAYIFQLFIYCYVKKVI